MRRPFLLASIFSIRYTVLISFKKGEPMAKYADFFKNCSIVFCGEYFQVAAQDMLNTHLLKLPNDIWMWENSDETLEKIELNEEAEEYLCFIETSYFSDHGYYCFVQYYLDGDEDDGVFRIKSYEFVHPHDSKRIEELEEIVRNSVGVHLK